MTSTRASSLDKRESAIGLEREREGEREREREREGEGEGERGGERSNMRKTTIHTTGTSYH